MAYRLSCSKACKESSQTRDRICVPYTDRWILKPRKSQDFFFFFESSGLHHVQSEHCCSVAKCYLTLCNPMDCSTPGFPVLYHLPEFTQTHVHSVSNAVQPSHPLSSPSPPAFTLPASGSFPMSQHFSSCGQSIGASVSVSVLPMNIQD